MTHSPVTNDIILQQGVFTEECGPTFSIAVLAGVPELHVDTRALR